VDGSQPWQEDHPEGSVFLSDSWKTLNVMNQIAGEVRISDANGIQVDTAQPREVAHEQIDAGSRLRASALVQELSVENTKLARQVHVTQLIVRQRVHELPAHPSSRVTYGVLHAGDRQPLAVLEIDSVT
jgi:hypothetical protein